MDNIPRITAGIAQLDAWARRNNINCHADHLRMELAIKRVMVHSALDTSLRDAVCKVSGLTPSVFDAILTGGTATRASRLTVSYSLFALDPVFDPGYVPYPKSNPYKRHTVGHYAWRALFFCITRLNFPVVEGVVTPEPEVNFYGEPLHGLSLALMSAERPAEHEEIYEAVRFLYDTLMVGRWNHTARIGKPEAVRQLCKAVGLHHNIWGDRLYNPPL